MNLTLRTVRQDELSEFKKEMQEIGPWDKTVNLLMKAHFVVLNV